MKRVPCQRETKIVLVPAMDDTPALNLARAHVDGRLSLPVHRQESRHRLWPHRVVAFDRTTIIEHHLIQDKHPLPRAGDFRHICEVTLHDQRPGHAAHHLHIRTAVVMRMIPERPGRMVRRDRDLDVIGLPRFHRAEDVVRQRTRIHVQTVRVEIRCVEMMRQRHVERHGIWIGRHLVAQTDAQHVPGANPQRGARDRVLVGPQGQPVAANIVVGVTDTQIRSQLPVGRLTSVRLDQRGTGREWHPRSAATITGWAVRIEHSRRRRSTTLRMGRLHHAGR